ncbi:TadE/TadG family type IV pilus assembly protein [Streptomyces sp. BE303]|uniref:TadE/TadG family type IV pilus assembly protein n=1 Tax=Streptomyces sp. BE303 TaxID=3002528 RepID=UPI002E7A7C1C|nr:TadE/TadG family type IV pilus assembly protein [Streptomyces sp. BE303]MED7949505.1 TadE/TadG family type IV pilus assembly protein [Streptomyces sp. BE303]
MSGRFRWRTGKSADRPSGWAVGRARGFAAARSARSPFGRDGGGFAVEAAIVAPAVVGLILVTVAAGRVQTAAGTVEAAARSAARTASLARGVDAMDAAAKKSAVEAMEQQGVHCASSRVTVAHGELVSHGTTMATVTVSVRCEVGLSDLLGGPNLNGPVSKTLTGSFVSVVDRYRGG